MKFNKIRFAAGILSVALLVTGVDMTVFAMELDKILPVAGLDLTLNEGVSMKKVAEEKGLDTKNECYIVEPVEPTKVVKDEIVEAITEDYSNLVIADVDSYVNIRNKPSEDGDIVGKLYDNSVGDFLEEENGSMHTGWLKKGNDTYYFDATGEMITGRRYINGKWYTFNSNGVMQ